MKMFTIPKIKILLVIGETTLLDNRGKSFIIFIANFLKLIKDFTQYTNSMLFIFTNIKEEFLLDEEGMKD
jgi:hypothetical protein